MGPIAEHSAQVDGQPVFWRTRRRRRAVPVLYLHGVPTSSDDWLPFLARTGGIAPDLPGFGRSGKRGDLDYTMDGLRRLPRALPRPRRDRARAPRRARLGLRRAALGAAHPERVERLVVIDAVPLLAGLPLAPDRARLAHARRRRAVRWARSPAGRSGTRCAAPTRDRCPTPGSTRRSPHFDQGTQRAILRLYRSSPPDRLAAAGRDLGRLDVPGAGRLGRARPLHPAALRRRLRRRRSAATGRRCRPWPCRTPATGRGSTRRRRSCDDASAAFLPHAAADARARCSGRARSRGAALGRGWLARPAEPDLAAQSTAPSCSSTRASASGTTAGTRGHHLPGYSVLFPPLAALLGPRSSARSARWSPRGSSSAWPAAGGTAAPRPRRALVRGRRRSTLVTGRLTFALGLAPGARRRCSPPRDGRRWLAAPARRADDAGEPGRRGVPRPGRAAWWLGSAPADRQAAWRAAAGRAPLAAAARRRRRCCRARLPGGRHRAVRGLGVLWPVARRAAARRRAARRERALRIGAVALRARCSRAS